MCICWFLSCASTGYILCMACNFLAGFADKALVGINQNYKSSQSFICGFRLLRLDSAKFLFYIKYVCVLESTHLFPCYICQTGILAEFLLRYLHSGMEKRSLEYRGEKLSIRGLILKSIYSLAYPPWRTTSKFMDLFFLYIVLLARITV